MVLADNFGRTLGIVGSRWIHLLAGITWIGLLYYFNFVQTPAFAGFEAGSRTEATTKLVPRALWWFRWAAALTFLTGLMILGFQQQMKGSYFKTLAGMSIGGTTVSYGNAVDKWGFTIFTPKTNAWTATYYSTKGNDKFACSLTSTAVSCP